MEMALVPVSVDGHARSESHDVLEVLDALLVDHFLAERRDADWHAADGFLATRGGDDDFLERAAGGGRLDCSWPRSASTGCETALWCSL